MNYWYRNGFAWKSVGQFCTQRGKIPRLAPRYARPYRYPHPLWTSKWLYEISRSPKDFRLKANLVRASDIWLARTYVYGINGCAIVIFSIPSLVDSGYNEELKSFDHNLSSSTIANSGELKHSDSIYRTLVDRRHIRVVVLEPGGFHDEVRCSLQHVVLSKVENHYEALSHAWGSGAPSEAIYVSGQPHLVSPSVFSALRNLRYADKQRILWIDSICIDQSDLDERSEQVQLMGDIYAKADRVVVWLGNSSDRLIEALDKIYHVQYSIWHRNLSERNSTWNKASGDAVIRRVIHETCFQNIDWEPLNDLLSLPWFQRLWVVQEIVNSRRAVIVCGEHIYPWSMLGKLLQYLTFQNLASEILNDNAIAGVRHVVMMEKTRRARSRDSLFNVTLASASGRCSDPRDKILAVMGMAEGIDHFDRLITFNYSLSVTEFFKKFALWDISKSNTLRCLSGASRTSASEMASQISPVKVPSWVPDWTRAIEMQLFVRWDDTTQFSAAGDSELEVYFTPARDTIDVRGTVVGILDVVGSKPQVSRSTSLFELDDLVVEHLEDAKEWLRECHSIATPDPQKPMTRQDWDAFWRTMMCDLTHTAHPAPRKFSEHFKNYFRFIEQAPDELRDYLHNEQPIHAHQRPFSWTFLPASDGSLSILHQSPPSNSERFHWWFNKDFASRILIESSLGKWSTSRRFSRTQDGRLARVPEHAQPGDCIAIMHGSNVPYVLRKHEDGRSFMVIGECYAHGLMHGEALKSANYRAHILRLE